jgi:hypothetical protein
MRCYNKHTKGSQKVPGMVILHCNGVHTAALSWSSSKQDPCTHTHLLHPSCHCWKRRRKALFIYCFLNFLSSAVAFDLMSSMVAKRVPLRLIFEVGNSQTSLGARSGEYGGWVMTQQAMCGSVRYRDAETTVPACHLSRRFLRFASCNLRKSSRSNSAIFIIRSDWISYHKFSNMSSVLMWVGCILSRGDNELKFFHQRNFYIVSPIHFISYTTCFGYLVAIIRCDFIQ